MSPSGKPPIDITPVSSTISASSVSAVSNAANAYAGFWQRACAAFIDCILLRTALSVFGPMLGLSAATSLVAQEAAARATESGWLFLCSLVYFVGFESSAYQATPGKMVLGIKVTDMNGKRISAARAAARHLSKIISTITLGIGYLFAAFTERKQALHDMIAQTLVVRK